MKNSEIILIFLIGVVVLLLLTKKKIKIAMTRGYRNNNPGNIVKTFKGDSQTFWQGEIKGDDKRFKKFKNIEWGYRAIFIVLRSYIGKGVDTITTIINRYAPPHENLTSSYARHVSERTGIPLDRIVNMSQVDDIKAIVREISYIENGITPNQKEIEEGYRLFKS